MMVARLWREAAAFWQLQGIALGFSDLAGIKCFRPSGLIAPARVVSGAVLVVLLNRESS